MNGGIQMPILEISVVPVGTNDPSIGNYVSDSCKILKDKGIEFQVTATGTVIEGDMQQLMQIAGEMHSIPFKTGAKRVITNITID
jgi:uncharacterized protein (TIGR00106 family)